MNEVHHVMNIKRVVTSPSVKFLLFLKRALDYLLYEQMGYHVPMSLYFAAQIGSTKFDGRSNFLLQLRKKQLVLKHT